MSIEEYFKDWIKVLDKDKLNLIVNKLKTMRNITPPLSLAFKAFQLCDYNDLRIIMISQDPYPQKGVATGILFGNRKDTIDLSPSLKIIRDAVIDLEVPHNSVIFDPTLESWARQGILMLNSALTVEIGKVGSHTMLWRGFISSLIKNISEYNTGIIYVLFGDTAKTFKPYIGKNNIILEEKHPAYYARTGEKMTRQVFNRIDKLMRDKYNESINWFNEF